MKMSDFAKKHLLKFGWKEGKGLGKDENGITKPIKTSIKSNCEGFGYKNYIDKWWEKNYDAAIRNIQVKSGQDGTILSTIDNRSFSKKKMDKSKMLSEYTRLYRKAVLHDGRLIEDESTSEEEETAQNSVNVYPPIGQLHTALNNEVVSNTATRSPSVSSAKLERIALQDRSLKIFATEGPSHNGSFTCSTSNFFSPLCATLPSSNSSSKSELMLEKHILNEKEETEEDEYEANNNIMLQTLRTSTQSKFRNKRFKKKMNNLMQKLNSCSIKETEKSKCDLLKDQFLRNVRSRKESSKTKRKLERPKLIKKKNIVNINKTTKSQDELEYESAQMIQLGTNNDTSSKEENNKLPHEPFTKESTCLITSPKFEASKHKNTDMASAKNMKNPIYFHKTKKKNRNKHKRNRRSKIEDVIKNIANIRDIDVVTKALTEINLTEDVSSRIKTKPTQTHITPV